jgi:eukaryotic-like serine/threonine-protein kinase
VSGALTREDVDRLVMKPTGRRRLGKYVLLGRIGHGGMGKIYLAYAPGPHGIEKLLVVKRLHSHLTSDPVLVSSFLDEARLSMALSHPNIVSTFDVGDVDGRYFMVMEYIDGQNLGVVLRTAKRSGSYPSSALWAGMFTHVLEGLHAAHHAKDARGRPLQIIHRDVSPQNVLITYEGIPKLVDFGIAKAAMRVSETDAGVLKGKYAYMSPEQVRGEPLDARSDVFAAGIVLWEMLAGRRLFKADSIVRSVERILTEQPISPVRINATCDPEIAKVAYKALQKDREQRFKSALEMKEALEDAMAKRGLRTRQSDVRELMQRMFGDVITRQRTVLEAALSAGDAIAAADDDEAIVKGPNDSESDVSRQDLIGRRDGEATTPSVVRPSPLVTADAERSDLNHDDDASRTSVERKRGAVLPAPAPPSPPSASVIASSSVATQTHDAFSPEATETASAVRAPSRHGLAAALVLVGAVLAAGASWLLLRGAPHAPIEPVVRALDAGTQRVSPRADAGAPDAADAADAGALVQLDADAGLDELPDADEPAIAAASTPAVPVSKPPIAPARPVEKLGPSKVKSAEPAKVERPEATEPDEKPEAASASAAPEKGGFLSLDTVPWTVVYLGDKKLGETPLVNVPVPSGALELLLVNSDAGIKEAYIAKVKPGETFRQRLDLQ